jgi:hypothetical protein
MPTTHTEAKQELAQAIVRNIERGSEVAAALEKALLSLSGGALVFSMTFVNTLAPSKLALPLLFLAWLAFATSMIAVLAALRSLQSGLRKTFDEILNRLMEVERAETISERVRIPTKKIKYRYVELLNRLAIAAFIAGVLLLGSFVGYNLWFAAT